MSGDTRQGLSQGSGGASAPEARRGAGPLDNMGSNLSPQERAAVKRAERRRLREVAGSLLPREAVARCGRYPGHNRHMKVRGDFGVPIIRGEYGSYFSNIVTCKSVWHCPVCAAKIAEERRQEIAFIIEAHEKAGGSVFMQTLTQGHRGFNDPKSLRLAMAGRWSRMLAGKRWLAVRDFAQCVGFCRALELTHGKNGWHPHLHVLVFFAPSASSEGLGHFIRWLPERWIRYTLADGYECSEHAQRWSNADLSAGEYPSNGGKYDEPKPEGVDHKEALASIAHVRIPRADPVYGKNGPLKRHWRAVH